MRGFFFFLFHLWWFGADSKLNDWFCYLSLGAEPLLSLLFFVMGVGYPLQVCSEAQHWPFGVFWAHVFSVGLLGLHTHFVILPCPRAFFGIIHLEYCFVSGFAHICS